MYNSLCMFDICQDMKQLVRYDMLSDDCRSLLYNVTVVICNYKNKTELNFGFGRFAAIFLLLVTEKKMWWHFGFSELFVWSNVCFNLSDDWRKLFSLIQRIQQQLVLVSAGYGSNIYEWTSAPWWWHSSDSNLSFIWIRFLFTSCAHREKQVEL